MSYLDRYKARVNAMGSTVEEQFQNLGIKNFEAFLTETPSKVLIPNGVGSIMGATYIKSHRDYTEAINYLLTRLNEPILIGTIFEDSYQRHWIVTTRENLNPPSYNRYKTLECNKIISWDDQYGLPQSVFCYLVSSLDTKWRSAFDNSNGISIPQRNGVITVIMPTMNFAKSQKFIIGGKAWRSSGIDKFSIDGLMFVTLEEALIDTQTDNVIEEIADENKDIWTIQLNTNYYRRLVGDTFSIDYVVYHNGVATDEPVTITTNNDKVIIDNKNITANDLGTSVITVALTNQQLIKAQATIEIVETIEAEQIDYILSGNDIIKWGQAAVYEAHQFINGAQEVSSCVFTLSANELVKSTINGNQITLIANSENKTGTIVLTATFGDNHVEEKTIRIVSLWS